MINKMSTFPSGRIPADAHEWSCFLAFVFSCFHSLRIVCNFRSQNKQNQPASWYSFIKISCNNKCYARIIGCWRLFQTTIKNYKVPHFKSTDLNRIQVTIRSLAATYKLNSTTALCWLLPPVIVMWQTLPTMRISIMSSPELSISSPRRSLPAPPPVTTSDRCYVPHCLLVP